MIVIFSHVLAIAIVIYAISVSVFMQDVYRSLYDKIKGRNSHSPICIEIKELKQLNTLERKAAIYFFKTRRVFNIAKNYSGFTKHHFYDIWFVSNIERLDFLTVSIARIEVRLIALCVLLISLCISLCVLTIY